MTSLGNVFQNVCPCSTYVQNVTESVHIIPDPNGVLFEYN